MRAWLFLLGGMIVWAADFFLLYAIGSIFLTSTLARGLAIVVTLAALAADAWLLRAAWAAYGSKRDRYARWMSLMAAMSASISIVGVLWLGLPPILS